MSTSAKNLGRFELKERIDADGITTVYRAIEQLGQGLSRPAAVKILQSWSLDDEEQLEQLRREVGVLVDAGGAPNVVSVFGLGVDDDMGAWIAMELAGRSLRHFIRDEPAEPELVRSMLRDVLQALDYVHTAQPPILHRDLKPQNILTTRKGVWKVADFGLAKRAGSDDTMALATVKYAAPELLDGSLGPEGPQVDLYALGMVAYELALGKQKFREQFPSVYDPGRKPSDEEEGDDRPKWMYWHTSAQMKLQPLTELIEGYPEDISELVAALTAKNQGLRLATAAEALELVGIGHVSAGRNIDPKELEPVLDAKPTVSPIIAGAAAVAIVMAMIMGFVWFFMENQPELSLSAFEDSGAYDAQTGQFITQSDSIEVAAVVSNWQEGMTVEARLAGGSLGDAWIESKGEQARFRVPLYGMTSVDTFSGEVLLLRGGSIVARQQIEIRRESPETIQRTVSVIAEARGQVPRLLSGVRLVGALTTASGKTIDVEGVTNQRGAWESPDGLLAPGHLVLAAEAAGYELGQLDQQTGMASSGDYTVTVRAKSVQDIQEEVQRLLAALRRIQNRCEGGLTQEDREEWVATLEVLGNMPLDSSLDYLVARMQGAGDPCSDEAMEGLSSMEVESGAGGPQDLIVAGAKDGDSDSMANALIGRHDRALRRVHNLYRQKRDSRSLSWDRLKENELAERVEVFDGIAMEVYRFMSEQHMKEHRMDVDRYMNQIGRQKVRDDSGAEAEPPYLEGKADMLKRPTEGIDEPQSNERMDRERDQRSSIAASDDGEANPMDALLGALGAGEDLQGLIAGLDPQQVMEYLAGTGIDPDLIESLSRASALMAGPAVAQMGNAAGADAGPLSAEDQAVQEALGELPPNPGRVLQLMMMPLDEFYAWVQGNLAHGTLSAQAVEGDDLVRIRGLVFSSEEHKALIRRVGYGLGRLQLEVRIDPHGLTRNLRMASAEIVEEGVFVDAYLGMGDETLFYQYPLEAGDLGATLDDLARSYVYDGDLLWIRAYAEEALEVLPEEQAATVEDPAIQEG